MSLIWSGVEPRYHPGLKIPMHTPLAQHCHAGHMRFWCCRMGPKGLKELKMRRVPKSLGACGKPQSMIVGVNGRKLPKWEKKKKKKSLKHPSPKCCDPCFLIKCYIKLFLANSLCVSAHEIYLTASPPFSPNYIIFSVIEIQFKSTVIGRFCKGAVVS